MLREVEVKYHVDDLEALLVALKARGIELSGPVYQDDQAYAPDGWQFGDSKLGVSFLRLRTVDGRHYFAVKQPGENAQACLEYETEVADRAAMHGAILHMGYYPTVRVAKARRTAALNAVRCVSMTWTASAHSLSFSAWCQTTCQPRPSRPSWPRSLQPLASRLYAPMRPTIRLSVPLRHRPPDLAAWQGKRR